MAPAAAYRQPLPGERFAYGGLSCVIAACITNPMDLAKIRLQIHDELVTAGSNSSASMAGAAANLGGIAPRAAAAAGSALRPAGLPMASSAGTAAAGGSLHSLAASAAAAAAQPAAAPRRPGLAATLAAIVRDEGLGGLMRGVTPSMLREASYSTIRYGAYEPIKSLFLDSSVSSSGGGSVATNGTSAPPAAAAPPADAAPPAAAAGVAQALPLWKKVAAGGVAGALGAAGATPSDLIKVRMQAYTHDVEMAIVQHSAARPPPVGVWQSAQHIYRHEGGLPGLYRGVWPTTVRAAILTASQLPVYDHCKHWLLSHSSTAGRVKEGPGLHFICSMVAGFACAFTTAPVDIVKTRCVGSVALPACLPVDIVTTRYMNQQFCGQGRPQRYAGMVDCAVQAVRSGGVLSLWAGFLPSWIRLGPHTCISLLVFEWLRQQAGLAPI